MRLANRNPLLLDYPNSNKDQVDNLGHFHLCSQKIKEYVDDHYKYYAFYPYDVEVDGKLYSYEEYMAIIHSEVII